MKPLACWMGLHRWRACGHLFSATRRFWHCDRCGDTRTTTVRST